MRITKRARAEAMEHNKRDTRLQGVIAAHQMWRNRVLKNREQAFIDGFWLGDRIARGEVNRIHDAIYNNGA